MPKVSINLDNSWPLVYNYLGLSALASAPSNRVFLPACSNMRIHEDLTLFPMIMVRLRWIPPLWRWSLSCLFPILRSCCVFIFCELRLDFVWVLRAQPSSSSSFPSLFQIAVSQHVAHGGGSNQPPACSVKIPTQAQSLLHMLEWPYLEGHPSIWSQTRNCVPLTFSQSQL